MKIGNDIIVYREMPWYKSWAITLVEACIFVAFIVVLLALCFAIQAITG